MNTKELREMTADVLKKELLESRRELFKLRVQKATDQLPNAHSMRRVRRMIARMETILSEKTIVGKTDE